MAKWGITIGIVAALLLNSVWFVPCEVSPTATISTADTDETVPDCCKHGLCPHHAAEQHRAMTHSQSQNQDCICKLSAPESATVIVQTTMIAELSAPEVRSLSLPSAGASHIPTLSSAPSPDLFSWTPPPRA